MHSRMNIDNNIKYFNPKKKWQSYNMLIIAMMQTYYNI